MPSLLGVRSAYSFLYGVHSPAALVERARAYGAGALALTDRNGLFGLHALREACAEAGIKAVAGAELRSDRGALFVFVLDRRGYGRLCRLLSLLEPSSLPVWEARFPWDTLETALREDGRGLALASFDPPVLEGLAGRVSRLYGAVGPGNLHGISAARRLGLPLLALEDALFLDRGDEAVHAVLRAIALGKALGTLGPADRAEGSGVRGLLLPPGEREAAYASWPEATAAADALAEECRFDGGAEAFAFPSYLPGEADCAAEARILRERVYAGAEARYGELSDAHSSRIEYELDIIGRKGFAAYFLLMADIVSLCPRTCGRGSAAASVVSYALRITDVDPIGENLYFERFLNPARTDPPDIDVDFPWDERDDLIRLVLERFGRERCARVANHIMFRPRSAFRECAKAYGYSDGEVSRAERTLAEGRSGDLDPAWREIQALAARLEGLPRGLSMHCGGLVITPGPIRSYAPILRSAQGYPLLAWEKEGTEAAGLVKLDLLGNRSLAVIRDARANLAREGIEVDFDRIRPAEDAAVQEALARGDSLGVFYIESPAMRQLQKKTGRGDFGHIVIHSSLIRPAANRFIAEYCRRLKGGAWKPLHPRLEGILDETYGILCYQEDVSKAAVALASFDEAEADGLRKIIAKKAGGRRLETARERFYSGCLKNGVDAGTADEVWAMMLSFDGYSFCKPHSASYAMVSFQSAYLRVRHGAYFMAAVLSNRGGYYHAGAYVSEARRMGLSVLGPDANLSDCKYRASGQSVIVGLMAIADLSAAAAQALTAERERRGAYTSLKDVSSRIHLSTSDLAALVSAGVFDALAAGRSRPEQLRALLTEGRTDRDGLFPSFAVADLPEPRSAASAPAGAAPSAAPPAVPRDRRDLAAELAALGFLRDRHPLTLWKRELSALRRDLAADLPRLRGRRVVLAGLQITRKEVWTADGLAMNFVSFEDETALYETVLFPEVYEAHRNLLFRDEPLIVEGRVVDDQGALCVELTRLRALGPKAL